MSDDAVFKHWNGLSDIERKRIRYRFIGDQSKDDYEYAPTNSLDYIPILNHGYVALLDHMGTDIDIVNAARKSFNKESNFLDEKDKKLLKYLWDNKHTSPFEMCEIKLSVMAPIFVARQWMRHRSFSFSERSMRYTDDRLRFYLPETENMRKQSKTDRQASVDEIVGDTFSCGCIMIENKELCLNQYHELLKIGLCREQARMVLPQSLYTEFVAKVDLHNLLHFLELRLDKHAQWEIQQYAEAIVEMLENIVPETMKLFKERIESNGKKIQT
jgi:thymidylate synthase (FAD)